MNDDSRRSTLLKHVHLAQLKLFLNATIDEVLQQQQGTATETADSIDEALTQLNQTRCFKVRLKCGVLVPKTKRKCPQCKDQLCSKEVFSNQPIEGNRKSVKELQIGESSGAGEKTKSDDLSQRYEHVPSGHSGEPPQVMLMDPVLVNPNSFGNIVYVLRHIGKQQG